MPANTANRAYPYSLPTDPTDIPGALQSLATAIDADVCALTASVTGRPVSRFRGTGTFASLTPSLGATVGTLRVPFDTTDFNEVPATMQSQEVGFRMINPTVPGFYAVQAYVDVPVLTLAASIVQLRVEIRKVSTAAPGGSGTLVAGTTHHFPVTSTDRNVRRFNAGSGVFMNGTTDAFSVEFFADTTPDVSEYVINERELFIMRMTTS
jgi:hypothetical protein